MDETARLRLAAMNAASTARDAARAGNTDGACHMITALETALLECCTELDRLAEAIDLVLGAARPTWSRRMLERAWERLGV